MLKSQAMTLKSLILLFGWVGFVLCQGSVSVSYPYKEKLDFTPLARNHMLSSFSFELNSTDMNLYLENDSVQHYSVFPKALGPVLQSTKTRELHLRFSQGWYDSDVWGKLPNDGHTSGGTGVELWALVEAKDEEEAFKQWIKLANSLSGMFCASLNFIDSSSTTFPEKVFQPNSPFLDTVETREPLFLFRSALPREPICTENLTPFLKLLPTKGRAGISSLLKGHKYFNSQWNSMSIDITTDCSEQNSCHYNMKQHIDLIFYIPKTLERKKGLIPKPTPGEELRCDMSKKFSIYQCFPMGEITEYEIDLMDIFGKNITGGVLFSEEPSTVCAHLDLDHWDLKASTSNKDLQINGFEDEESSSMCFQLTSNDDFNLKISSSASDHILPLQMPLVTASRSLAGYSQDSGGLRVDLTNPSLETKEVVLFQTFPWFVRLYLHTLTVSIKNGENYSIQDSQINSILKEIIYDPAIDREKPTLLELSISLPADTSIKITFQFDKSMLLLAEYPPDANHGFEIEPAVVAVFENGREVYISRTTSALLTLPTPDFSMPYNVIILTSTVMSLTFGAIYNFLSKKVVTVSEAEKVSEERMASKLLYSLRTRREAMKAALKARILLLKSSIGGLRNSTKE